MKLPIDIIKRIHQDYEKSEKDYVIKELTSRYETSSTFGAISVIRAILFLSNGDIAEFKCWLNVDDWRTTLYHAEMRSGNYGHYFGITFDEIDNLEKVVIQELTQQIIGEEELPGTFFEKF